MADQTRVPATLVIPQTAVQRVIPNAVLGRVSATFLTGEAAATLLGAAVGPFLAQAGRLPGVATAASLVTLSAAALTWLIVPRMAAIIPVSPAAGANDFPGTPDRIPGAAGATPHPPGIIDW